MLSGKKGRTFEYHFKMSVQNFCVMPPKMGCTSVWDNLYTLFWLSGILVEKSGNHWFHNWWPVTRGISSREGKRRHTQKQKAKTLQELRVGSDQRRLVVLEEVKGGHFRKISEIKLGKAWRKRRDLQWPLGLMACAAEGILVPLLMAEDLGGRNAVYCRRKATKPRPASDYLLSVPFINI